MSKETTLEEAKQKLLNAFDKFRPHINGHHTAIEEFFEGIELLTKEAEQRAELIKAVAVESYKQGLIDWWSESEKKAEQYYNEVIKPKYK